MSRAVQGTIVAICMLACGCAGRGSAPARPAAGGPAAPLTSAAAPNTAARPPQHVNTQPPPNTQHLNTGAQAQAPAPGRPASPPYQAAFDEYVRWMLEVERRRVEAARREMGRGAMASQYPWAQARADLQAASPRELLDRMPRPSPDLEQVAERYVAAVRLEAQGAEGLLAPESEQKRKLSGGIPAPLNSSQVQEAMRSRVSPEIQKRFGEVNRAAQEFYREGIGNLDSLVGQAQTELERRCRERGMPQKVRLLTAHEGVLGILIRKYLGQ